MLVVLVEARGWGGNAEMAQELQIRPAENHGQVGGRSSHRLGHVVDDRLGETEGRARYLGAEVLGKLLDEVGLGLARFPCVIRLQSHEQLIAIGSVRIRS